MKIFQHPSFSTERLHESGILLEKKVKSEVTQSCLTVCDPRLLRPWDSPGNNTGVGCHFLLQGNFPTQGSNLGLQHWGQTLPSEPPGNPFNNYQPIDNFLCLFRSSAHFLIRLFEILLSNDMSSLCILVINTFQIWGLQVFLSRSWGCFFVLAKHLPTMLETWVQALGREVPLEKEMATHSRIPAWKIPWTEEPSRLKFTFYRSYHWRSHNSYFQEMFLLLLLIIICLFLWNCFLKSNCIRYFILPFIFIYLFRMLLFTC